MEQNLVLKLSANQINNICLLISSNSSDFSESKLKKKLGLACISPADNGKRTLESGLGYSYTKNFNKSDWLYKSIMDNYNQIKSLKSFQMFLENTFSIDSFQTIMNKDDCIRILNGINIILKTAGYQIIEGKLRFSNKATTYESVTEIEQIRVKQVNKEYVWSEYINKLIEITKITNAQKRGYALEKYLNFLFTEFNLEPRAPYKLTGEQIDGSIKFDGEYYLVEAKYTSEEIKTIEVVNFAEKLNSKSGYTRGIFVSYSKITDYVFDKYNNHGAKLFIVYINDIFFMLDKKMTLQEMLSIKIRALAEEGKIYVKI